MGITLLVKDTIAYIWPKKATDTWVRLSSTGTLMTRILKTEDDVGNNIAGEILTAFQDKRYFIPAGMDLFAITDQDGYYVSVHEIGEEMNPRLDQRRQGL